MKLSQIAVAAVLGLFASFAGAEENSDVAARAKYNRAQEYQGKKDWAAAEKLFAEVYKVEGLPAEMSAAAGLEDGKCLIKMNRLASARVALEAMLADFGYLPDYAKAARLELEKIPADAIDAEPSSLGGKSIALSFTDATVAEVADYLAKELKVAVFADAGFAGLADQKVTVDIANQGAPEALRALAAASKTAFVERSGFLVWTSSARADSLAKRPATAELKGSDKASEAALAKARGRNLTGSYLETTCARFIDNVVRETGLVIDAEGLPDGTFSLNLGEEVSALDVLDLVAFEFGLTLAAKDGRLVLTAK